MNPGVKTMVVAVAISCAVLLGFIVFLRTTVNHNNDIPENSNLLAAEATVKNGKIFLDMTFKKAETCESAVKEFEIQPINVNQKLLVPICEQINDSEILVTFSEAISA